MHADDLCHHRVIDVQSSGGIDDQYIGMRTAALVQSPFHDHLGILAAVAGAMHRTDFPGEHFQLKNSGRPVNIHAYQHDPFFVGVDQPFRKLGGGRRLARSL